MYSPVQDPTEPAKILAQYVKRLTLCEGVPLVENPADTCGIKESSALDLRLSFIPLTVSYGHPSNLQDQDLFELLGRLKQWIRLQDHHLIRFQGLCLNPVNSQPTLVFETPCDDVIKYIAKNPGCDRLYLVQDALAGLCYLHSQGHQGFIHGDIRGDNVFVKNDGRCYLGAFSPNRMPSPDRLTSESEGWFAPELFDPNRVASARMDGWGNYTGEFTQSSDLYAFGCLVVQVYTGELPRPKRFPPGARTHHDLWQLSHSWTEKEMACVPCDLLPLVGTMLRPNPKNRRDSEQHLRALRTPQPAIALSALKTVVPPIFAKSQARRFISSGLWKPLDLTQ